MATALRFCRLIVITEAAVAATGLGANDLTTRSGTSTVKVPLADAPVGALLEVTAPVLLT